MERQISTDEHIAILEKVIELQSLRITLLAQRTDSLEQRLQGVIQANELTTAPVIADTTHSMDDKA